MTDPALFAAMAEAQRDSIALALAAWRGDPEGVAVLWNNARNRDVLLYTTARLPSVLAQAVAARDGLTLDPEEVLADLLAKLPA